ncbi:enoyl-CoA hydratase [Mesorhizobium sp. L-8-10]|uniref:MaoC family dehydratase n=1 Tax=unclassified Mesorhizobium TaxID=325217 RepID=UPI0019275A39|nr:MULTISPECIES: MaoC family dehydratase [unclassified Mesorhizobium]BCH24477.1 enoyl-CoA hydratase [Mesorhizobium sp. L-8-3]BCH32211.1 enoyl-CoA hydratase [Mesorhizobium sp. L-8-10]
MTDTPLTFATMPTMIGKELGVSSWITVDQEMINQFAETTRDKQWIHIDVERAKRESPFRAPVAHGYLTLSLVAAMSYEIGALPEGTAAAFNYGLDKVRFLTPVKAGARVRMRSTLVSFDEKGPGQFLMKANNVVEIEGEEKPALIAETLAMLVAAPPPKS